MYILSNYYTITDIQLHKYMPIRSHMPLRQGTCSQIADRMRGTFNAGDALPSLISFLAHPGPSQVTSGSFTPRQTPCSPHYYCLIAAVAVPSPCVIRSRTALGPARKLHVRTIGTCDRDLLYLCVNTPSHGCRSSASTHRSRNTCLMNSAYAGGLMMVV